MTHAWVLMPDMTKNNLRLQKAMMGIVEMSCMRGLDGPHRSAVGLPPLLPNAGSRPYSRAADHHETHSADADARRRLEGGEIEQSSTVARSMLLRRCARAHGAIVSYRKNLVAESAVSAGRCEARKIHDRCNEALICTDSSMQTAG